MTRPEAVILSVIMTIVAIYVLYWIIRVAVCHGTEDAHRRAAREARATAGWDPARPS